MKTRTQGLFNLHTLTGCLLISIATAAQGVAPSIDRLVIDAVNALDADDEAPAAKEKSDAKAEGSESEGSTNKKKQATVFVQNGANTGLFQKFEKKDVAWLGLATEEASEPLASQLGLHAGEGLLVTYVVTNSPAAAAGVKKNDLLVDFEGQRLVLPAQLRKLVQMREEGEKINLTLFRGGQKQTVSATLGKTKSSMSMFFENPGSQSEWGALQFNLHELPSGQGGWEQMQGLHESLALGGLDKKKLELEIRQGAEQARKAVTDAMRESAHSRHAAGAGLGASSTVLDSLNRRGVEVNKDATVTIMSRDRSTKTIVKTDDSGTYVVVANPHKRLTAHDKEGKLLFDGDIETEEQQAKVPGEVWEVVKPMVEQVKPSKKEKDSKPDPAPKKTSSGRNGSLHFRTTQAMADARTLVALLHYIFEAEPTRAQELGLGQVISQGSLQSTNTAAS